MPQIISAEVLLWAIGCTIAVTIIVIIANIAVKEAKEATQFSVMGTVVTIAITILTMIFTHTKNIGVIGSAAWLIMMFLWWVNKQQRKQLITLKTIVTILGGIILGVFASYTIFVLYAEKELTRVKEEIITESKKNHIVKSDDEFKKLRIENEDYKKSNSLLQFKLDRAYSDLEELKKSTTQTNDKSTPPAQSAQSMPQPEFKPAVEQPIVLEKPVEVNKQAEKANITVTKKSYSLMEVCPPYQFNYGEACPEDKKFAMSGAKYSDGFVLKGGNIYKGFALVNLQGKYSKLTFEAGHIDGTDMLNKGTTLHVFLNGKLVIEKYIPEDRIAQKIIVPLNYASELKIQVIGGGGNYGIANLVLED